MDYDGQAVVRKTVRKYLETEDPKRLEEFEEVFDDVFEIVRLRIDGGTDADSLERLDDGEGVPFDAGVLQGTAITVACWIATCLSVAALKYAGKSITEEHLSRLSDQLIERGAAERIVRKIQTILLGVIQEL